MDCINVTALNIGGLEVRRLEVDALDISHVIGPAMVPWLVAFLLLYLCQLLLMVRGLCHLHNYVQRTSSKGSFYQVHDSSSS